MPELGDFLPGDYKEKVIVGPKQRSDEWYALRKVDRSRSPIIVMGASDAPVVLGVSPYKSRLKWFYEKIGLNEPDPPTQAMRIGQALEPYILDMFLDEHGISRSDVLAQPPILMLRDAPFIGASVDAFAMIGGEPAIIEVKSASHWMYNEVPSDKTFGPGESDIPVDYKTQVQCQMLVSRVRRCYMAVLFDTQTLRYYKIAPDDDHQRLIRVEMEKMHTRLLHESPPEDDDPDGPLSEDVKTLYRVSQGKEVWLSDSAIPRVQKVQELKEQIRVLKQEADAEMARILIEMKDAEVGNVPGCDLAVIRRSVEPTFYTQEDVEEVAAKVGTMKRKGYVTTRICKRKA